MPNRQPKWRPSLLARSLHATWARFTCKLSKPVELTPELAYTVMGILKAADKRRHIASGMSMTDQLKQACRMAIRTAKRDMGPPKEAEPIALA